MPYLFAIRTIQLLCFCLATASEVRVVAQSIRPLPPISAETSVETLQPVLPAEDFKLALVDNELWWDTALLSSLNATECPLAIGLEAVVNRVLMFSPHVRIVADEPVIRGAQVTDAASRFDPRAFLDSKFTDTSDPVGNLLTTGGASRYLNQNFVSSGGLRQTFASGAKAEVAQKFGYEDSNSRFFIPPNQGTSRITLTITQPLLNGSGKAYNLSSIYLAELGVGAAVGRMQKELQDIIIESHRAYWDLRVQRAALLQRARLKQQAIDVVAELEARVDFDVVQSQIVRARAAAATREAAVIRFGTNVANAATRLRALLNDPNLLNPPQELIPFDRPWSEPAEPNVAQSLTDALQYRPEIQQAFIEVRAASIQADVSQNELMPLLNLVLGTYVAGLQGNSDVGQAWVDQFSVGRPTYWTGLQFEYPLFNRGANARLTQRRVELRQATNRLQAAMLNIRSETEIAVREVSTLYREMLAKRDAIRANAAEIDYLTSRRSLMIGDPQTAGVVLDDLLSAQERRANAEFDFVAVQAAYNVSLVNLNRATGTLLQTQQVRIDDACQGGVPTLQVRLDKSEAHLPIAAQLGDGVPAGNEVPR
ncbi:MAG: TolC family protein [Planctomycetia bacterium]|nr:TolC family protein [Planctomycetia bacterium]